MTDKEFKRLNRSQLIDIIYQMQLKQEELIAENARLTEELNDRRILLDDTGNIAEASLRIHKVMQAAQDAVEHYSEELHLRADEEAKQIIEKAQREAQEIIADAEERAIKTAANT